MATSPGLSPQDIKDLQEISTHLQSGDPRQKKISMLLNAAPTQFEQDRNPSNQSGGFLSTAASDLAGAAKGLYQQVQQTVGNTGAGGWQRRAVAMQQQAEQQQAEDDARKASGRGLPYRVAAAVAPLAGVNATGMEQAADVGNNAAILGHAAAAAAPLVAGEAIKRGPAIVDSVPSARGAMAARLAEVPPGEQFSRGDVLNAARDNGVNLDLAQATDSGVAHALKKANRYSIASQGTYDAAQTKNLSALEDWANKTTESLSPDSASREVIGGQLQAALKNHLEARKSVATQAFRELDNNVGQSAVDRAPIQTTAQKIVTEYEPYYSRHPELLPKQAWSILNDLANDPVKGPQQLSWNEAHQLRSDLQDFYRNSPDVIKGKSERWIQQMVSKIDDTMTGDSSNLSPQNLAKFREANDIWQSVKSTYDNPQSPYYHAVRAANPSQVPAMLSKGTPELATQVRATIGSLEGPFQRQFAENLLNGKDGMTLDLKNLNAKLGRVPQDFLVSMLGEEGAKNIRMLGKVASKVTADANPSGTAKVGVPAAELGSLFSINAPGAAAEMGAQYVGAKALNSPRVVDFFTKR